MRIDPVREAKVGYAVAGWAHARGVCEERPIVLATAKATVALRRGATANEACGIGCSVVRSWLRHPSNRCAPPTAA